MKEFFLREKSGFRVIDKNKPVVIRDYRGIMFYTTEHLTPNVSRFNLPAGKYFCENMNFRPSDFVVYKKLSLPRPERVIKKNPGDFKVLFGENPYKCTIDFNRETILFDKSFIEKPLPEIYFVLFHEHGHRYFKTEHFCDAFATNKMLEHGFNPSQIGYAHLHSLSNRQIKRKQYNINRLINEVTSK